MPPQKSRFAGGIQTLLAFRGALWSGLSRGGRQKKRHGVFFAGEEEIDFQPNSSLMVLRNACKAAWKECGVYYFNWKNGHFALVKRALVDLTKLAR